MPRLSIIIPTYNSEKFIGSCLESVLNQTFQNFEVLIVDGLSKDATSEVVKGYSNKDEKIKWYSEIDNGIYDAMNKGIKMAKGDYMYFLGSDDVLFGTDALQTVFDAIEKNNFPDFIYGNVLMGDSNRVYNGEYDICKLHGTNICHQAIFYKRSVFDTIGLFDLSFPALADWHFNFKCFLNKQIEKKYIPILVARFASEGFSGRFRDDPFPDQKDSIIRSLAVKAQKSQYHLIMRYMCNTRKATGKLTYLYHNGMFHLIHIKNKIYKHITR